MGNRDCVVQGCNRAHYGRGFCRLHWVRQRRYGRTEALVIRGDDEARLWSNIRKGPSCWIYTGSRNSNGYGRARRNLVTIAAHRYVYELLVGPIPDGLTLDHLCRVRACVRPDHLEPVTQAENVRRGIAARAKRDG